MSDYQCAFYVLAVYWKTPQNQKMHIFPPILHGQERKCYAHPFYLNERWPMRILCSCGLLENTQNQTMHIITPILHGQERKCDAHPLFKWTITNAHSMSWRFIGKHANIKQKAYGSPYIAWSGPQIQCAPFVYMNDYECAFYVLAVYWKTQKNQKMHIIPSDIAWSRAQTRCAPFV